MTSDPKALIERLKDPNQPMSWAHFSENMKLAIALITEQAKEIERLKKDLARANKPWSVRLSLPDPVDIYTHHECTVIDTGHSDRVLIVECEDAQEKPQWVNRLIDWPEDGSWVWVRFDKHTAFADRVAYFVGREFRAPEADATFNIEIITHWSPILRPASPTAGGG